METFDFSALNGYYTARINQRLAGTISTAPSSAAVQSQTAQSTDPLPWRQETDFEALLRKALSTGDFLPQSIADRARSSGEDTEPLLTAYRALLSVKALADAARDNTLPVGQLQRAEEQFQKGLLEVTDFVSSLDLRKVNLLPGERLSKAESEAAIARSSYTYTTNTLHNGDFDAEVDAFTGDRVFTITVSKVNSAFDVEIDLSEMGATPRNLDNVAEFINGKLEAAGSRTTFERVKIGDADENGIIAGTEFGFQIEGNSTERISFSAADATPSAYLVGTSGSGTNQGAQFSKWSDIEGVSATRDLAGRLGEDGKTTDFVAVEAHPDGGFVAVGTTDGAIEGRDIRGETDVVLSRFDSQGKLLWTRLVGGTGTTTATGLAVSSNGTIALTGTTDARIGADAIGGGEDGFVAVYTDLGEEQWLRQRGVLFDDAINAVAFADDGSIVVAGRTAGSLSGDDIIGGSDAYVEKLDANGDQLWVRQWGTAEGDRASAVTVASDGAVIVAGLENGEAVVRRYLSDTDDAGDWAYSMGNLHGGGIADIELDSSGNLFVSGSTRATTDGSGVFSGADQSHTDGFVGKLDLSGGTPTPAWMQRLGGEGYQNAGSIALEGDRVYVSGTGEGIFGAATSDDDQSAFLTALDTADGNAVWTESLSGRGGISSGAAIAIDTRTSGTLDAFGLPSGALVISDSAALTDRLPLRAGDHFYVSVDGGRRTKIEIEQGDNMRALSFKVNSAILLDGRADIRRSPDGHKLRIEPNENVKIELFRGDGAQDALGALGLTPGALIRKPIPGSEDRQSDAPEIVTMDLVPGLSLLDEDKLSDVADAIDAALRGLRTAYRWAIDDPTLLQLRDGQQGPGRNQDGVPPAYLTSQINNLQAGLNRLLAGAPQTSLLI